MKFFTMVYTFNSSSELGHRLSKFVIDRYLNAIISLEEAESIQKMMEDEMSRICKENPSFKPMEIRTVKHGGIIRQIHACEKNRSSEKDNLSFDDSRPVSLTLFEVFADHSEKGDTI